MVVGWLITLFFYYHDSFASDLVIIGRLNFGFIEVAALAIFMFAYYFPKKIFSFPKYVPWLLLAETLALVGITTLTGLVSLHEVYVAPGQRATEFGILYIGFVIHFLIYMIAAVGIMIWKLKKLERIQRFQVIYLIISVVVGVTLSTVTNIIIPFVYRNFAIQNIGSLAPLFFIFFSSYAIIKYRLFNIQIQLQKTVNTVIPIVLSTIFTVLLAYILYEHTEWHGAQNGIILLIFYTISYKFFNYLLTRTGLNHFFFRKTYHFHQSLIEFANHASNITDFDHLLKQTQRVFLSDGFIEAFAFFIITDQEKKACHVLETHNFDAKDIAICAESVLHPILYQELSHTREPLVIEELPYSTNPQHHALREAFNPLQGGVCIPLFISNDLAGIILLGAKTHGGAYTTEDIEVFQKISIPLAVAVTKAALFAHLSERVTRLDQENNNLETANHELQEMKSEFLTIVNHQLNTPLSVMRSVMSMIKDGDVPLSEVQEYVKQIDPKMEAFAHIVQDMLDAAEFEGAGATLKFQTVDVNDALQKTASDLQELSKQNKVTVHLQSKADLPRVLTDPDKFLKALNQLIKNAIVYGREKTVAITTEQKGDHVIISIRDNGRGFDKEEAEKIGTKFFRGKKVADYLADGSGLGVYTAKKIVEASGGALTWESQGLSKGSSFMINLPKAMEFVKTVAMK